MKKIQLNKKYYLVKCEPTAENALNGFTFVAEDIWVISTDNGPRFATRYTYTTLYSKSKGLYFKCGNAKAAIQQCLITEFKNLKLRDIYFQIIKNEK